MMLRSQFLASEDNGCQESKMNTRAEIKMNRKMKVRIVLAAWLAMAILLIPRVSQARYLNVNTGRFQTMDTYAGNNEDPLSLHKYLYVEDDPVDKVDPWGTTFMDIINGQFVHRRIGLDFVGSGPERLSDSWISTILSLEHPNQEFPIIPLRPDLIDMGEHKLFEIKPLTSGPLGVAQLVSYLEILNHFDPLNHWTAGTRFDYTPPSTIKIGYGAWAKVQGPRDGVITYEVLDLPALALVSVGVVVTAQNADTVISLSVATLNTMLAF
jgi:hypothetical protein